jgi:hypothetical protein
MFRLAVAALLLVAVSMASADHPGVALFSGFLKAHPEIKAEFPKFKNVADDDLADNADMISHAGKIATILGGLHGKTNWDDIDALSVMHKGIGQTNKVFFDAFRAYAMEHGHYDADDMEKFYTHLYGHF